MSVQILRGLKVGCRPITFFPERVFFVSCFLCRCFVCLPGRSVLASPEASPRVELQENVFEIQLWGLSALMMRLIQSYVSLHHWRCGVPSQPDWLSELFRLEFYMTSEAFDAFLTTRSSARFSHQESVLIEAELFNRSWMTECLSLWASLECVASFRRFI